MHVWRDQASEKGNKWRRAENRYTRKKEEEIKYLNNVSKFETLSVLS